MGLHLWLLSSPNQGVCGDCQVRSAIILLALDIPQTSQWDSAHLGLVRQTKALINLSHPPM